MRTLNERNERILYKAITIQFLGSSGCNLNAEEKSCLVLVQLEHGIESLACDVATEDKETQKKCHQGFKAFEQILKSSCAIALDSMCSDETCPQNHNKKTCTKRRAVSIVDKSDDGL